MAAENRNALAAGTEFEGYRIDSVLGAGGFGITYRAIELSLDREVAIKEYLPSGIATRDRTSSAVVPINSSDIEDFEWGLDRFRQEARVLVSLKHPNIVPVLRFFEAHGTAYMAMEYQHGMTLGQLLTRDNFLEEHEIRELIGALLDGLTRVHDAGFLHRDIKPDNIFIREDGVPVLIDFGSARQSLSAHSKSVTAIISEGYAPYEQYQSGGERGPATDIYAIGGTIYRCMTGNRPPDAPTRLNRTLAGEPDPLRPPSEAAKGRYSRALCDAVAAALQVLEKDRPQSIAELQALLGGLDTASVRLADAPAPKAAAEEQYADPGATTRRDDPRGLHAAAPQAPAPRRRRGLVIGVATAVVVATAAGAAVMLTSGGSDGPSFGEAQLQDVSSRENPQDDAQGTTSDAATDNGEQATEQREPEPEGEAEARGPGEEDEKEAGRQADAEAEAERQRAEEEAGRRAEEEARRQAEARAEEERQRREDAARLAQEEAVRRQEEEAARQAEAERQRQEEEARRQAEAEAARQKQEEDARSRAEARVEDERRREAEAEQRRRQLAAAEAEQQRQKDEAQSQQADPGAELRQQFAGAAGYMSKEISVGHGPANIQIQFSSGGGLRLSYEVGQADSAAFGTVNGSWSIEGGQLCMRMNQIDGGQQRCYAVSCQGSNRCRLSGGGELNGELRMVR